VNGTANLLVTINVMGSHDLTVIYGGDGNFTGSASAALTRA
jgi:hypothetical protein